MAITKILARNSGLNKAINYVMNGDKTEEQLLVATQICSQSTAYEDMIATKRMHGKEDGIQCYHLIQSYKPGEATPEQALEIAQELVQEIIPDHEAVIGVHVDREHIHAHIVFNSVAWSTGEKYSSTKDSYYEIRSISDRLCQEHGLSVLPEQGKSRSVHYGEWVRQQKGYLTYRSMLEADLKIAMEDANDLGHFIMIMEGMGYEVRHGNRLGFRFQGQEQYIYPERQNPRYSEKNIRAYINKNLQDISLGLKPVYISRQPYIPYRKMPKIKYTGIIALYYHYVYLLESIEKQRFPPKTPKQLREDLRRFEEIKAQFYFLRNNEITCRPELDAFMESRQAGITQLAKQRTILNVRKKKRKELYDALTTEERLKLPAQMYANGDSSFAPEASEYAEAVKLLDSCGIPREELKTAKAEIYNQIAEVNFQIRQFRKELKMCRDIIASVPTIEKTIREADPEKPMKRKKERVRGD